VDWSNGNEAVFVVRLDGLDNEMEFVGAVDLPGEAVVFVWRQTGPGRLIDFLLVAVIQVLASIGTIQRVRWPEAVQQQESPPPYEEVSGSGAPQSRVLLRRPRATVNRPPHLRRPLPVPGRAPPGFSAAQSCRDSITREFYRMQAAHRD
jgi:hypothetical protein